MALVASRENTRLVSIMHAKVSDLPKILPSAPARLVMVNLPMVFKAVAMACALATPRE